MATALSQHAQDQIDKIALNTTGTIHPASNAVADLVRFSDIDFPVLRSLSGYEIVDCKDKRAGSGK